MTDTHRERVCVGNATLYAGELVDIDDLRSLPDPEPIGPNHHPLRFDNLMDCLHDKLAVRGLGIKQEVIGLANERQRLVSALEIDSPENRAEFGMHIGLFSSTDQFIANKLAFGTEVFACTNTALSAEFLLSRKSTRRAFEDLPRLMENGIGRYIAHFTDEAKYIENWMETGLADEDAKLFCWDTLENKIIRDPRFMFNEVWPRVMRPEFEEHRRGTVYALMNAFTGAQKAKGGAVQRVIKDSVNVMGFLKQRFPIAGTEIEDISDIQDVEIRGLN